jgi:hypothetical protein
LLGTAFPASIPINAPHPFRNPAGHQVSVASRRRWTPEQLGEIVGPVDVKANPLEPHKVRSDASGTRRLLVRAQAVLAETTRNGEGRRAHLESGTRIPIRHWIELIDTLASASGDAHARSDASVSRERAAVE